MKVTETALPGVLFFEPRVHGDPRGFFVETFHAERYRAAGLALPFVQDNLSRSVKNTLRGLHFQDPKPQGKLVMPLAGTIFDVAVDLRPGSATFGRWVGRELAAERKEQLWVPPGFAPGFCVLSDSADVLYKCTDYYAPECERTLLWSDPALGIDWPVKDPLLSARDRAAPALAALGLRPQAG